MYLKVFYFIVYFITANFNPRFNNIFEYLYKKILSQFEVLSVLSTRTVLPGTVMKLIRVSSYRFVYVRPTILVTITENVGDTKAVRSVMNEHAFDMCKMKTRLRQARATIKEVWMYRCLRMRMRGRGIRKRRYSSN